MKPLAKLGALRDLAAVKFLGRRIPVAVRMQITNRCPNRCAYCSVWSDEAPDPSREKIFSVMEQLGELGTRKVSFSGGEPLLRDDIGEIIGRCKELGISPEMNSRGTLIERRIAGLKGLDLLKVSVDGPEEVHDALSARKGAFRDCVKAIETAQAAGIRVSLATTITRHNIGHLDFILGLAKKYGIRAAFQPLKPLYRGVGAEEMRDLYPPREEYRRQIARLAELKADGWAGYMRNSLIGLRHIMDWPGYPALPCSAGRLFCVIDTDGTFYPCDRIDYATEPPNCFETGVGAALESAPPVKCGGCGFCGSLELNFLYNFRFGTLKEVLWLLK